MPNGVYERLRADGSTAHLARPRINGRRVTVGTFDSYEEAIVAIAAFRERATTERSRTITVDELFTSWRNLHVEPYLKPSTLADYDAAGKDFRLAFGHRTVASLDDAFEDLQAWAKDRAQNRVDAIRAMFTWGRQRRLVKIANPLEFVCGREIQSRGGPVILTDDEACWLAELAYVVHYEPIASRMSSYLKVAFGTALRPVQQRHIDGRHVDLKRNRVRVRGAKGGIEQEVAILGLAREGFLEIPAPMPDQPYFVSTTGERLSKGTLYNWWGPIRTEAAKKRPEVAGMVLQDLRDSALTRLVKGGASWHEASKQATHVDNGQTLARHYVHIEIDGALDAVEAVDKRLSKPRPATSVTLDPAGAA